MAKKKKSVAIEEPEEAIENNDIETTTDQINTLDISEPTDTKPKKKKKLSNKERRKLKAQQEAAEREIAYKNSALKETKFAVSSTSNKTSKDQFENSIDIDIPEFTISAYGKTLFQDAQLKIVNGRKYGLVGANGRGKSTLLRHIASGDLKIPPKIDCLYVEQEVKADETTALEMVLKADKKREKLLKKEEKILKEIDYLAEHPDDFDSVRMDELQEELNDVTAELKLAGNDTAEARALSILYGLGFDSKMQVSPTKNFSGGWRMRVSLARALFVAPSLLLLDEPTNHLDLNAVLWLDDYIQNQFKSTLLVVSHDQDFLDSVCTDIIHLDQQQLFYYRGNYSVFKSQLDVHLEKMKKLYNKQEKELRALKKSGKSNKKAMEAQVKKKQREGGGAKKNKGKNAQQASSSSGLSERRLLTRPKEYVVKFTFPTPSELSPPLISVDEVVFKYPKRSDQKEENETLFTDLTFGLDMDSRITIVGKNGVGKSTLLKLVTGELNPVEGDVRRNRHLRIGKYHQHFVDVLPMDLSPVEYLRKEYDATYQECRNRLGKFGLEGTAHELKMVNLSGGQKSRVVFTGLSFYEPHIMFLDEPTNNLDLESINALIDAINEFEGGVVLVSHDARLIQECEMTLWVCQKKDVYEVEGGFEEYKEDILKDIRRENERQEAKMKARLEERALQRKKKLERLERIKAAKK
eukprot:maker-scaffold_22-snap-gene-5.13-mRNA-1 protein AED:0.02 eAED:0.02 QI:22/1/1/1/1/1/2/105/693